MSAQIVSFKCVLKNSLGKVISSTFNRDVLTSNGSSDARLPGLAQGLQNLQTGEKRKIKLRAEEAYGFYDVNKVIEVPRTTLLGADELRLGETVLYDRDGKKPERFRVVQLNSENVVLDANHPLAGQDLIFEIEATDVRAASAEEILESQPAQKNVRLLH